MIERFLIKITRVFYTSGLNDFVIFRQHWPMTIGLPDYEPNVNENFELENGLRFSIPFSSLKLENIFSKFEIYQHNWNTIDQYAKRSWTVVMQSNIAYLILLLIWKI